MTERENILIDALISAGHIAEQARTAWKNSKPRTLIIATALRSRKGR